MKKLLIAAAFSLIAGTAMAERACITTGNGSVHCGEVVVKY
jgi:hypothetical protein